MAKIRPGESMMTIVRHLSRLPESVNVQADIKGNCMRVFHEKRLVGIITYKQIIEAGGDYRDIGTLIGRLLKNATARTSEDQPEQAAGSSLL